ncbi:MAG: 2Fe-2S iron-sulfur cluster binding domain-containing protein, partial [Bdellovibrionaceae bacterium]|nr:2Fe-2S iron-sulfur cluster binding domain-containing protein [Pseudobdellovibrionaceae bacterium]
MSSKHQQFIVFLPEGRELSFIEGDTVLDIAEFHRIGLAHSCGGMGSCGTCRILIEGAPISIPARE